MSSFPVSVPLRLTKCFQVLMLQDRVNERLKAPPSQSGKEAPTLKGFWPHLPPIGREQVAKPSGPGTPALWPGPSSCIT